MFLFKKSEINNLPKNDTKKDNVTLNLEGNIISLKEPIYLYRNRYFLPLNSIIDVHRGKIKRGANSIKFTFGIDEIQIKLNKKIWINKSLKDGTKTFGNLVRPLGLESEEIYISLIDFSNMLGLKTRWKSENKEIKMYKDRDHKDVKLYNNGGSQKGILRLEDVAIGGSGRAYDSNYLECTRYMGAFLGKRGVPYHIAWIPRYIDKKNNIDGDPSKENKFTLAELVYTLDYLKSRLGVIGLHGYTHQRDDEESGIGNEFGADYPSVDELKERVEKALEIAKYLDIEIEFFEAPHYVITLEQNIALQNYFKHMLNNYNCEEHLSNQFEIVKANDINESYYIPTPLYYVDDRTGDNMINTIANMDKRVFAGLFYHPIVEHTLVEFIEDNDGYPLMKYNSESTMKKVIQALENRKVHMMNVNEINF